MAGDGGKDFIADASLTRAIYEHQRRAPSKTELHIFANRSQWTCLDTGWEAVADLAFDWARVYARESTVVTLSGRAA